jgi:hypothetical protein
MPGMSLNTGAMKKAPPITPTIKPNKSTKSRFFLPIKGVRRAVENTNAIKTMNSIIMIITAIVSMVSSLIVY